MAEAAKKPSVINLDSLLEIAMKGVRRGAAFLALGANSARDPHFISYQLPKDCLQFFNDDLPAPTIAHFKSEFEKWIVWNVLRELIESFAAFLDEAYRTCLLVDVNKKIMTLEDARSLDRSFEHKGVPDKLSELRIRFGIATEKETYIVSINRVRNSITHRRGLVGERDTRDEGVLRVHWWAMDLVAVMSNGGEVHIAPPFQETLIMEGGQIVVRIVDREREFKLGDSLQLSVCDVAEICHLMLEAAREIRSSLLQHLKQRGVTISSQDRDSSAE